MAARLFIFISAVFVSQTAFGFVQNVTHGYPSCIACHVSPSGGGLLTDYGRSLSKELMSTWGVNDSFAQPFFGAVKNRETVKFGGDFRTVQTFLKNRTQDEGRFFPMQQNVEVGVQVDNVMFVGTAGLQQGPDGSPRRGQFLSERHYALWSPTLTSRVRVGKFRQTFGIYTPNHFRYIRQFFGFGALSETYNLEFTQFYETYEVTLGSSLGRLDQPRTSTEQNLSAHYTYYLNENSRLGGSVLMGESSLQRRFLSSLNAVMPLGESWTLISELVYEQKHLTSNTQNQDNSVASLIRLGQSPVKGLMIYGVFEHLSQDRANSYTLTTKPGLGVQWFPVPHFNIQLEYAQQTSSLAPGEPSDVGFMMFHMYL